MFNILSFTALFIQNFTIAHISIEFLLGRDPGVYFMLHKITHLSLSGKKGCAEIGVLSWLT